MTTNLIYGLRETAIKWADSAQTPDNNLTLSALAAGAGRVGVRHDFGATAGARDFIWRSTIQMATAGVVGETIDLYASTSDGTNPDGEEGTADAALGSTDSLTNMTYLGSVRIDTTSIDTDITASGRVRLDERYVSIVVHNNTADALKTDTAVHSVTLTPVADQIQAAV